jgi:hypothetical protein
MRVGAGIFSIVLVGTLSFAGIAGASNTPTTSKTSRDFAHASTCVPNFPTNQIQICALTSGGRAGRSFNYTVARYQDFSNCNFPAPPSLPGENANYIVAQVRITWGDGTRSTAGVAHRGTGCAGTSDLNSPGELELVTGVHNYKKPGRYNVSVLLIYERGSGNTYPNCASVTGGTVYNGLNNCIALGGVVHSIAVAHK